MFYTWFNSDNRVFSNYCFLFSSCEQVKGWIDDPFTFQITMATSSHPLSQSRSLATVWAALQAPPPVRLLLTR